VLIDAFINGLCKESQHDFPGLSTLLANLPDPSPTGSHGQVEAMPVAEARAQSLIPEAFEETLQAFSCSEMKLYQHATAYKWTVDELIATIYLIARCCCIGMESRAIVAKSRCVDIGMSMSYEWYMTDI
jgi:hypothetical protein